VSGFLLKASVADCSVMAVLAILQNS